MRVTINWKIKTLILLSAWTGKSEATRTRTPAAFVSNTNGDSKRNGRVVCMGTDTTALILEDNMNTKKEHVADIRYVNWAGSKGLLPLQMFRNVMKKKDYEGWLRKPLPLSWEEDELFAVNTDRANGSGNQIHQTENKTPRPSASRPLDPNIHLQPIYVDSHIVVVNKESGALSVPGPRQNPSVAGLVHEYFGNEEDNVDCMIVHRLDMDTSGVICYARNKPALSVLHNAFRSKTGIGGTGEEIVYKKYEALVCGHMQMSEGEIDLPLVRDPKHPPFMKVSIGSDGETGNSDENEDDNTHLKKHKGYLKMISRAPKESLSVFRVLAYEWLEGLPVTRLELVPITGRTHQLRVHCAAIGHPIIGDDVYGFYGNGSPDAGLPEEAMSQFSSKASWSVQSELFHLVQQRRLKHDTGQYSGNLCLHAKELNVLHPITKAPMSFETCAPF